VKVDVLDEIFQGVQYVDGKTDTLCQGIDVWEVDPESQVLTQIGPFSTIMKRGMTVTECIDREGISGVFPWVCEDIYYS
jgi:hypothetical protein